MEYEGWEGRVGSVGIGREYEGWEGKEWEGCEVGGRRL